MKAIDLLLVEEAKSGDAAAIDLLLTTCRPRLQRYASQLCHSEDVEEAVQDALSLLAKRIGTLRTVAAFAKWLFQIIKRECLQRANYERRDRKLYIDDFDDNLFSTAPDSDLRLDLARGIASLAPPYREVLLCRDIVGLNADETAVQLAISVETVKSRLHRARHAMRNYLDSDDK